MKCIVNAITKQLNLDAYEAETLLHDVNNLRGNEWLQAVEEGCDNETVAKFKELIGVD